MNYNCEYAIAKQKGLTQWIECKINHTICPFSRRCRIENKVVNTEASLYCKLKK